MNANTIDVSDVMSTHCPHIVAYCRFVEYSWICNNFQVIASLSLPKLCSLRLIGLLFRLTKVILRLTGEHFYSCILQAACESDRPPSWSLDASETGGRRGRCDRILYSLQFRSETYYQRHCKCLVKHLKIVMASRVHCLLSVRILAL